MIPSAGVSLAWLLDGIAILPDAATAAAAAVHIEDLTLDSRAVRAGSVFLALRGLRVHGLDFATDAAARGACAVLWDPATVAGGTSAAAVCPVLGDGVFAAPVSGLDRLVGRIADRFFGRPSSHMRVVGITGTNGKTTCAFLLAQALGRLQREAAYMGTIGWGRLEALHPPTHTTPDVVSVHRQLAQLRAQGVLDVAMEVSSHALAQGRVDGVRFCAAAFTNLTRDHLDLHGTMQEYGAAKAQLFATPHLPHAIVNVADAFGRELAPRLAQRLSLTAVWVGDGGAGTGAQQQLYGDAVELNFTGLSLTIRGSFGVCRAVTRLLGRFNAENVVVVLGCLTALGQPLAAAVAALADCTAPPGRMEVITAPDAGKPVAVIDYAHTPDALDKALRAAREHCRGALWCVFGCGGDRDPGKRPLMGAIAAELADAVIVTDDNPRNEDPDAITRAIVAGTGAPGIGAPGIGAADTGTAGGAARAVRVIHDRGTAIATALREAGESDMVMIAGKGHEDYQIYGSVTRRFSDRDAVCRSLGVAA